MLSVRTIIGIVVGGAITAIGVYALITSLGIQQGEVEDTYSLGEPTTYQFYAPKGSKQWINITGDTFSLDLTSPLGGLQVNKQDYKEKLTIEWVHIVDGESILKLQNTGNSDLNAKGYFTIETESIFITYHILVIIAGIVIIGFSGGFSVRKPRGF